MTGVLHLGSLVGARGEVYRRQAADRDQPHIIRRVWPRSGPLSHRARPASVRRVTDERSAPGGHQTALQQRPTRSARSTGGAPPTGWAGEGAEEGPGFRAALRALRPVFGQQVIDAAGTALALERFQKLMDPPSVAACTEIEAPRVRAIEPAAEPGVCGFLDGIQRSRIVAHANGSPIVHGTVAAAVRRRVDRQLECWRTPRVRHALYAARREIGEPLWESLESAGLTLTDIEEASDPLPPHPMAARGRAMEFISSARETLERGLAAEWCRTEHEWLWVDGPISGNVAIDERACAFGVVKSHATLYGTPEAIRAALALRAGERSPAFLIGRHRRSAVASWYLRLRDSGAGDPLHALVRVEAVPSLALLQALAAAEGNVEPQLHDAPHLALVRAVRDDAPGDVHATAIGRFGAHADTLSSWILAERLPLSRPDPRWDTLTYGVHACEEYLKAVIG